MAMKPGLRVSQTQQLALTPALRQSISILRLSGAKLNELVTAELEQNPLLILESDQPNSPHGDFQFALENVAHEQSLSESLTSQITMISAPEDIRLIAKYLACDLTDQGFISDSDAAIAETLSLEIDLITHAISILQSCEPTGIGARNLAECLDLQLIAIGENELVRKSIIENLSDFAISNWPGLKQKTGLGKPKLRRLAAVLQSLNPFPATVLTHEMVAYLQPDVRITPLVEGGFSVEALRSVAPTLRVDQALFESTKSSDPGSLSYLQTQSTHANDLIRAIEARSKTVLRLCREIVVKQHLFFTLGHSHLIPQTQAEIAVSLGLHPSTVARAVANKALICPLGVFPLKFFFTTSLNSLASDATRSAYVVQQEIRNMINAESPNHVLSDDQITSLLHQSGVDIARRTVAKYRQCLKIPSSVQRRRSKKVL